MDCSTPVFPVHHQLPEVAKTHVRQVGDAIQPSHPLSSLLLMPSIFPSIRVFFKESVLRIRWSKYWSFSFSISHSNEYSRLISFRIVWFYLLAVQGTLKSLLQSHSSKASILWHLAFFVGLRMELRDIEKSLPGYRLDPNQIIFFLFKSRISENRGFAIVGWISLLFIYISLSRFNVHLFLTGGTYRYFILNKWYSLNQKKEKKEEFTSSFSYMVWNTNMQILLLKKKSQPHFFISIFKWL